MGMFFFFYFSVVFFPGPVGCAVLHVASRWHHHSVVARVLIASGQRVGVRVVEQRVVSVTPRPWL